MRRVYGAARILYKTETLPTPGVFPARGFDSREKRFCGYSYGKGGV